MFVAIFDTGLGIIRAFLFYLKYSTNPCSVGFIAFAPAFQLAGQTSPCCSWKIKRIEHPERFIDRAAQGKIVDELMADDSLFVDQE